MSGQVVLCVDSESARRPELIGLSGERLDAQSWLSVFEDGATARTRLRECRARSEAWVVSSDDVDAINLAATLKRDAPVNSVYLVSFRRSGSLRSRASAAGLDGLLDFAQFAERYRACKRRSLAAGQENAGAKSARIMAVDASGGMEGGLPARSSAESHPGASGPMAPSADGTIGSGRLVPPSTPGPVAKPAPSNAATPGRDRSSVPGADSEFLRGLDLGETRRDPAATPPPVSRALKQDGNEQVPNDAGRRAFVLVVASASGGSGKSTVAALSAVFAQGLGHRALLVDADFQFGDAHIMLGAKGAPTFDGVAEGAPLPAPSESELPAVLAAPRRLEDSERLAGMLPGVIDRASASFDVVVVNTGSLWGEQHAVLVERASRVLFLVDQRASSLQACKRALSLCERCGIPTGQFLFAVNRCKRGAPLSSIDAACLLQGASVVELRDGGRAVDELMAVGQPLGLIQDENPLCVSLENVLADILPGLKAGAQAMPAIERMRDDDARTGGALSRLRRRVACLC